MARAFYVIVVFCLLLSACTQKVVCPAYQSAFIYDKDALRKKFSYFNGDSTPKVLTASRNKYLIGVPVSYKKKVRTLQTVSMTQVIPVVPDSLKEGDKTTMGDSTGMDVSGVERNVNDSTAVIRIDTLSAKPSAKDSVYVISKEREVRILKYNAMKRSYFVDTVGFNTEQDNYMWYLKESLLLPDARIAKMAKGKGEEEAPATKEKKKGLFKRKQEEPVAPIDSTKSIVAQQNEDYGYNDFEGKVKDSTVVEQQPIDPKAVPDKKKKEKNKKSKRKSDTPPAKKEESDDGF
jgi:hypothetical protein